MPNITVVFEPAQLVAGTASINESSFREMLMPLISPMIEAEILTTEKDQWIRWFRNSNWFANSMQEYISNAINTDSMRTTVNNAFSPESIAACLDSERVTQALLNDYRFTDVLNDHLREVLSRQDLSGRIEQTVKDHTTLMANDVVEKVLSILSEKLKSSLDI